MNFKMTEEIKLGDQVECIHTGLSGTAIARTEFINGCIQWSVLPRIKKKSKSDVEGIMPEEVGIDQGSLKVIGKPKEKVEKKRTGGAINRNLKRRYF